MLSCDRVAVMITRRSTSLQSSILRGRYLNIIRIRCLSKRIRCDEFHNLWMRGQHVERKGLGGFKGMSERQINRTCVFIVNSCSSLEFSTLYISALISVVGKVAPAAGPTTARGGAESFGPTGGSGNRASSS